MKHIVLRFIRLYQQASPVRGWCRFLPTCSEYTYQAVERYGIIRGSILGLKRVLRCHPWSKGGIDMVP